jgi:hypothetical protein
MPRTPRLALGGLALCALLAAFVMCLASPVWAQGPGLTIDKASLRLWPEYDDPGLLVILSGNVTGTASFPQQVAFPIPANARGIQATFIDANGALLSQQWQIVDGKLTYALPSPDFQIEYYLDRPAGGNQRDINFAFESPYPIRTLEVAAQQPARASAFAMTPQSQRSVQGSDGFTTYLIDRANMGAGDKLPINIRYTKNDQGLSVAQAKIDTTGSSGAAGTVNPTTAASGRKATDWLPIVLIGLGVALLAGAAIYWFLRIRPTPAPAPVPAKTQTSSKASPSPQPAHSTNVVFCTQCGRQLSSSDRFCAQCGTPRKN